MARTVLSELSRLHHFLDRIQIVMVNTTLPANIGSAARAMHTMGLRHLTVVNPKHPIDADAMAHAAGASAILDNVKLVATLPEAITDCQWVLATSSRQRHIPKPVLTPRQAADLMLGYVDRLATSAIDAQNCNTSTASIAIVFGREDRGLTNDELQLADYHIQIPANPDYSVLNVAAAVQVIASVFYEMAETHYQQAALTVTDEHAAAALDIVLRQDWDAPAINHSQQQQLEQRLMMLLAELGIYHPDQSKVMPQRLSRLLGRLQLDVKEYQLLQAAIAKLSRP